MGIFLFILHIFEVVNMPFIWKGTILTAAYWMLYNKGTKYKSEAGIMNLQIQNAKTRVEECAVDMRDDAHVILHSFMRTEMNLKHTELLIFAIIYGFFRNGMTFSGSRTYLAEWAGVGLTAVDNSLASLINKGYIEKLERGNRGVRYSINVGKLPDIPMHRNMISISRESRERS
jgi:hypothetical protein